MKITYFFPIFKEDNADEFFKWFFKTNFYSTYQEKSVICVVNKDDKNNIKALKKYSLKEPNIKIFLSDKTFSYNSAFKASAYYFDGDVVLLGDLNVPNIDLLFEKCLKKHSEGAKIVNIKKTYTKIKAFFVSLKTKIYNFFVKMFTGKKDECNVISLGLLDKDVIDVFKVLPHKNTFLKNTKDHYKLDSATIFVDYRTPTNKVSYKKPTLALKTAIISASLFDVILLGIILMNVFVKGLFVFNILSVMLEIILLIVFSVMVPKHIFDCRNIVYDNEMITISLVKKEKQVIAEKKIKQTDLVSNARSKD